MTISIFRNGYEYLMIRCDNIFIESWTQFGGVKRMVSRGDENISQQIVMKIHQNRWKVNREILLFEMQFLFLMMVFSSRQCHFVMIECCTEYTNLILDYGIYFYLSIETINITYFFAQVHHCWDIHLRYI